MALSWREVETARRAGGRDAIVVLLSVGAELLRFIARYGIVSKSGSALSADGSRRKLMTGESRPGRQISHISIQMRMGPEP